MNMLTENQLMSVFPSNQEVMDIARQAFLNKSTSLLPPKTSIGFNEGKNFITTMPLVTPLLPVGALLKLSMYLPHR
jgi:hypothetical protein